MSDLLAIRDNLLKASAEELLRTDLLHMTTKEQNIHKEFLPNSYRTGLPPTRLHTNWKGLMRVIKGLNSRYTLLNLITGKEKDYHVSDMKPFVFKEEYQYIASQSTTSTGSSYYATYSEIKEAWKLMKWQGGRVKNNSNQVGFFFLFVWCVWCQVKKMSGVER